MQDLDKNTHEQINKIFETEIYADSEDDDDDDNLFVDVDQSSLEEIKE